MVGKTTCGPVNLSSTPFGLGISRPWANTLSKGQAMLSRMKKAGSGVAHMRVAPDAVEAMVS